MKIQELSVVLDDDGRNILTEKFSEEYEGIDKLDSPDKIVQVMNDVFCLSDKAEKYLYLICMTASCSPICFCEVEHGTHDSAIVGIREIFVRALLCGATDIVDFHRWNRLSDCIPSVFRFFFL